MQTLLLEEAVLFNNGGRVCCKEKLEEDEDEDEEKEETLKPIEFSFFFFFCSCLFVPFLKILLLLY